MAKRTNTIRKNLDVKDRIVLLSMLPKSGGLIQQMKTRELARKIEFTSKEIDEFELRDHGNNVFYNPSKKTEVEFLLTNSEVVIIEAAIDRADKEEQITPDSLDTVLKFKDVEDLEE